MKKGIIPNVLIFVVFGALALFSDNRPTFKLVMLGDSITASSTAKRGEKIPDYVQNTLNHLSCGRVEWLVINEGVGRDTAYGALKRIGRILAQENPEFVSIAYGLVDCDKKDSRWFEENINKLLLAISSHDPKPWTLLITITAFDESIHAYGKDRYFKKNGEANRYINSEINGILRMCALNNDLPILDLFKFLTSRPAWKDSIKDDGIHPNSAGNRLVGEYIGRAMFAYYSAHIEKYKAALQAESDTRQLMKSAFQRLISSRGRALQECVNLEEQAWRICPYLPAIMDLFALRGQNDREPNLAFKKNG
jgi:lysophospholipase L1-like esterase